MSTLMALYALVHPDTLEVRYIGITTRGVGVRLRDHIARAARVDYPVSRWIRKMLAALGRGPSVVKLGEGGAAEEVAMIARLKAEGARLLNGTDGGDGCANPTPETRAKMSAWQTGRTASPETLAKMSAANKGRVPANKGRAHSPETRAKMTAALKGRTAPQETRAKMSAAQKARFARERGPAPLIFRSTDTEPKG